MKLTGHKLEMSQIFLENGNCIPVTIVAIDSEFDESILNKEVVVVGTSKGAGFTGPVKRFHFKGGPKTHGQSDRHRAPGSSGSGTTPGRVLKGKRRAGRHGSKRITLKGLHIVELDLKGKQLKLSGPLPGARNSKIVIEVGDKNA